MTAPRSSATTGRLTIRPMLSGDIDAVANLEIEVYPQPWSSKVFREELALANRRYVVAEDGTGSVVGYAGLLLVEDDAHVTTLAVDPQVRRRRLGSRLMLALVAASLAAHARHLTLEVRMSNLSARRLYEQFGFAPVGIRKNYYRDEDALVMWAIDIDTEEYEQRVAGIEAGVTEVG
jgi:ribosomal-protein-alanine N-acetyltransferase